MITNIGILAIVCIIVISITCQLATSTATENKVMRSKSSRFQFSPKSQSSQSHQQSSSKSSKSNNQNSKTFLPAALLLKSVNRIDTKKLPQTFKKLADDFRDEVVDCFDAIAFAETNVERLDNLLEIAYRHRPIIAAAGLCAVAKIAFGQSHAVSAAERVRQEMRLKEASKWGSRSGAI